MSQVSSVAEIKVDDISFPSTVKPPASNKTLFLGGAGIRGLEKEGGKFVKVMGIGVYMEDSALPCLAEKWKGKSAEELTNSAEFFTDVITGPFEKFTRVTMVLPISGQQYAERMSGSCTEYLKSAGTYSDAEAKAIQKFVEAFKEENFSPGASMLFTQLANGSLAISFSQDESIPKVEKTVIENKLLSEALLESMIGKNGVSPATKKSLADRLSVMLKQCNENGIGKHRSLVTAIKVDTITFSPTVKPPASKKTLFLGGAGIRGLEKEGGKFVKVMGIGVYLEDTAVPCLAMRWKGKSAEELNDSIEFFTDIITGYFEKFTRVTMVLPITGQQYAERISGSCIEYLKSVGTYTDAEAKAIEKFMEAFKEENFPPGASILFTQLANGSLAISFSKDESLPEIEKAVIENKPLSVALLELMIGKNGISPTARKSLAERLSQMLRESMSPLAPSVTEIHVETVEFPPAVKPPATEKTLFLAGAGVRGLEIEGKFVKFTAIGFYLEDTAVTSLAVKWKGKSADELNDSVEFFRDIVTGPFEKFARVTTILQLTGQEYSSRVAQKCTANWKAVGIYTDAEAKAIEKFVEAFKDEIFPPGSSFLYTQFPSGSLAISFSKDGSIPEAEKIVIENKPLSEAVLDLMIGKHGVSPAAKQSLASRLSELMKGTSGNGSIGN